MNNVKINFFKKLQLFDYLIIILFGIFAVAFFIFFFRKSDYITAVIKITDKNILYADSRSPSWFVYLLKPGMSQKDGLGKINAEILDVYYYDTSPDKKAVYVTLKLKTVYSSKNNSYKYQGEPVVIGGALKINLERVLVEGLVVEVQGLKNSYEEKILRVKTKLTNTDSTYSETEGVDPYVADAVSVGDKVYDSSGRVMVEVLEKEVLPAQKNTFDDRGNVYLKSDPQKKAVLLTLKISTKKINNEYYFFDEIPVKVGTYLPTHFKSISLYPVITQIFKD